MDWQLKKNLDDIQKAFEYEMLRELKICVDNAVKNNTEYSMSLNKDYWISISKLGYNFTEEDFKKAETHRNNLIGTKLGIKCYLLKTI